MGRLEPAHPPYQRQLEKSCEKGRNFRVNKKTQTVAFANLIGSVLFLALGIWAWFQMATLQEVKDTYAQPSAFPQIMASGLIIFSAILLVQSIIKLCTMKEGSPFAEKAASINIIKDKGIQAAALVIVLCAAFVLLLKPLGYVVTAAVISAVIMYLIGKRNVLQMILVSVLVPLGMWLIFYKVLTVNIPMGPLSFLKTLLDMI